jgi:hypothetical protein
MQKVASFLILFFASVSALSADSLGSRNYYIELKKGLQAVEIGVYGKNSEIYYSGSIDDLDKKEFNTFFKVAKDSSEALVYFHCMWGNEKHFHKQTLSGLNKDAAGSAIKTTFSIIWHANEPGYQENWNTAFYKGQKLKNIFSWITEFFPQRTNVLCHSMGHRIFQGIVHELVKEKKKGKLIKELIFASPDLDANVFNSDFAELPQMAERITIFKHAHDRLLKVSKLSLGRARLGLNGPDNQDSLIRKNKNIFIADATETESWRVPEPSNHVYFHFNPAVKKHLSEIFNHQAFSAPKKEEQLLFLVY